MLSCVRVQVHFKKNVSQPVFSTGAFIEKHRLFCKLGKVQKSGYSEPVKKSISNPNSTQNPFEVNLTIVGVKIRHDYK
jgi:hypothetical protein